MDFDGTYAPVARLESIRTLLAICAAYELNLCQFDISTAFLNGKLEEDVFIDPPLGLQVDEGYCLKLDKALYGLSKLRELGTQLSTTYLSRWDLSHAHGQMCIF